NVIEQVVNVAQTTVVRDAWDRGQPVAVHGWVYSLENGLINDLCMELTGAVDLTESYARALNRLEHRVDSA
ncbi:MAG: carbonic anhydrase, partial [Rudaea sp.]